MKRVINCQRLGFSLFLMLVILALSASFEAAADGARSPSAGASFSNCGYTDPSPDAELYCPECGRLIPSASRFCMYCGHQIPQSAPPIFLTPSDSWGEWSAWTKTPAFESSTRQVQKRTNVLGYYMVHYGTQEAESPYYRVFRNYSVSGMYETWGARKSYGEKHFTRYVTATALEKARQFQPGVFVTGVMDNYQGFQRGTTTAYYFGDDKYVWFIDRPDQITEYRYRDLK